MIIAGIQTKLIDFLIKSTRFLWVSPALHATKHFSCPFWRGFLPSQIFFGFVRQIGEKAFFFHQLHRFRKRFANKLSSFHFKFI